MHTPSFEFPLTEPPLLIAIFLSSLSLSQLEVSVEVERGRVVTVWVRERAPVITVMFKVAEASGLKITTNSGLFEISEAFRIREWIFLQKHTIILDYLHGILSYVKMLLLLFSTQSVHWKTMR